MIRDRARVEPFRFHGAGGCYPRPVQRQAAAQTSPSSSFTGTQIGGFGGGNAGRGGFADPATCPTNFSSSSQSSFSLSSSSQSSFSFSSPSQTQPLTFNPSCGTTTQNVPRSPVAASGGGEISYMLALGPYWVAGVAVDVTGSGMNASGTQTGTKVVAGTAINETFTTSQRQPFTTTNRARLGVVAFPNILIFLTAPWDISGNRRLRVQSACWTGRTRFGGLQTPTELRSDGRIFGLHADKGSACVWPPRPPGWSDSPFPDWCTGTRRWSDQEGFGRLHLYRSAAERRAGSCSDCDPVLE